MLFVRRCWPVMVVLFVGCSSGKSNLRQTGEQSNPKKSSVEGRVEKVSSSNIKRVLGSSDKPKFERLPDGSLGTSFMLTDDVNSEGGSTFDPTAFVLSGESTRISAVCQEDLTIPFIQKYKIGFWLEEVRPDGEVRYEAILRDVDCHGEIDLKLTDILADGVFVLGLVVVNANEQVFMIGQSAPFAGDIISVSFTLEYAASFKDVDVDVIYPDPRSTNGKISCNFSREDHLNSCSVREVVDGDVVFDKLFSCKVGADDKDSCLVGVYPDKTYEVRTDCPIPMDPTVITVAKKEHVAVELGACDFDISRLTQLVIDGPPSVTGSAGGNGHQFKASGVTSDGNLVDLTNLVSWYVTEVSGASTNIADISVKKPGFFRGLGAGVVNISACLGCGSEEILTPLRSSKVMYEITPAVIRELLFECQSPSEYYEGCKQLSMTSCDQAQARPIFPTDEAADVGNIFAYKSDCTLEVVSEGLSFQSSNPAVAEFNNPTQNLISFVGAGSTNVTATYQSITSMTPKLIKVEPVEFAAVLLPGMSFPKNLFYCKGAMSDLASATNNKLAFSAYELKTNCSVTEVTEQVVFSASPSTLGAFASGVPGELQILATGEVTVAAVFNDVTISKKYSLTFNQPSSLPVQSIFTTKNPIATKGNLGGLLGADALCQGAAARGGLGGDWMAFINIDNVAASSRLNLSRNIANLNGQIVASGFGTQRPQSQSQRTITDQFKQAGAAEVWLGLDLAGNCNGWSVDQASLSGVLGCPAQAGILFSCEADLTKKCDELLPLLCISKVDPPKIISADAIAGDSPGEVKIDVEFNDSFATVGMALNIFRSPGDAAPASCDSASGQKVLSVSGILEPIAKNISFVDITPEPGAKYSYLFCGSTSKGTLPELQKTRLGVQSKPGSNVELKHTIFLTANETVAKIEFAGKVGMLAADAKCQAEAEAASLGGPNVAWKALLNYSTINIKGWLVNSTPPLFKGPIGNVKGELVALTFEQFLGVYDEHKVEYDGELRFWKNKANYDAAKNLISAPTDSSAPQKYVFVGESGSAHCDDWTMGSGTTHVAGKIVGTDGLMSRGLQSDNCRVGTPPEYQGSPRGRFYCISVPTD